jgi:hypothetical protein
MYVFIYLINLLIYTRLCEYIYIYRLRERERVYIYSYTCASCDWMTFQNYSKSSSEPF